MKVLVATHETQGFRESDFSWTREGELVKFGFECDRDKDTIDGGCGCRRSMSGVDTSKATTTFTVVERNMTKADLVDELRSSYAREGWEKLGLDTTEEAEVMVTELSNLADSFPVGAVLEKRGDSVQIRSDD